MCVRCDIAHAHTPQPLDQKATEELHRIGNLKDLESGLLRYNTDNCVRVHNGSQNQATRTRRYGLWQD